MKKNTVTKWLGGLFFILSTLALPVDAANLVQIYHQALHNDPTFEKAQATWAAAKENIPIQRAAYLPQVTFAPSAFRQYTHDKPITIANGYNWQYGYTLSASQEIFDAPDWYAIRNASATTKAATATYLAAQQSLIQRTATAYFAVLQAYDKLRYTIASKRAIGQQLVTAQEEFKVGLIPLTNVSNARASYDQEIASEIAARQSLNTDREALRAITNREYKTIKGIGNTLPLIPPKPDNIEKWVKAAKAQNYGLKAQNYTVVAAMDTVKQEAAGGWPSLDLTGQYTDEHDTDRPIIPTTTSSDTAQLGLELTYKPIQGGGVIASTRQARDNYAAASATLEKTYRDVVDNTRSGFWDVYSGISQIKADRQQIISSHESLSETKAGLKVGTRNMVDVLNAITALYQAEQQHANDQYAYINSLIALKSETGTLSVTDLAHINSWLTKSIQLPKQSNVLRVYNVNMHPNWKPHPQRPNKRSVKINYETRQISQLKMKLPKPGAS